MLSKLDRINLLTLLTDLKPIVFIKFQIYFNQFVFF